LDVESVEVLFGLDIITSQCHDEVVFQALVADSPMGRLVEPEASVTDCQPVLTWSAGVGSGMEAQYEVKTRLHGRGRSEPQPEPISVYLTMRRSGPVDDVATLAEVYRGLASFGERLVDERVVPFLVMPIRSAIVL
jgi:hypothetical protein